VAVTNVVLNLMKSKDLSRTETFSVVASNANSSIRWRCRVSNPLQELHTDGAVLSEAHLKRHDSFFLQIIISVGLAASG
jgi:hypothetical protein